MRTTVNLDPDIFDIVKSLAAQRRESIGAVLSDLVRKSLKGESEPERTRNGVLLFPVKGRSKPVTPELIRELLEETE
jgi:hypothetical protein